MSEKTLRKFLSKVFLPGTPDGIVRATWIVFACTAPFLVILAWPMNLHVWVFSLGLGMWGFTFANAYLNRLYWRIYQSHQRTIETQQETLNEMIFAFHILHEHCPACGARFKAPELRQ